MPMVSEVFEKGCRAIKWNRYRQAERYLSEALALKPGWHDALQRRAFARERLGKLREAVADYRHALKENPRCDWCWVPLADIYEKRGNYGDAMTCLLQSIRLKPRNSSYRHDLGQVYLKAGKYEAAIMEFQSIRNRKGFRLLWRQGRGRALALLGMTTRALKDLDTCVGMRPDSGESWLYRGLVKADARDKEGALKDLRQARKLGSQVPSLSRLHRKSLHLLLRT